MILLPMLIFLSACATQLSTGAQAIQIVSSSEKHNCKMLGIVTASDDMGWDEAHDLENAIKKVRNKASELGANAIKLLNTNNIAYKSSSSAIVTAEALKCK